MVEKQIKGGPMDLRRLKKGGRTKKEIEMEKRAEERKRKKVSEFEEHLETKRRQNPGFTYPDDVLIKGVKYVREDKAFEYVNSQPEEIREKFLMKRRRKRWYNPMTWRTKYEEFMPKGNLLLLLDNEGNIIIYENVQSGYFKLDDELKEMKSKDIIDGKEANYIVLKPGKLRTIRFMDDRGNEEYWKAWIGDVNNINALPENPAYDCDDVAEIVNRAVSGNRAFNRRDKSFEFARWVPWIFGALVIIYMGYIAVSRNLMGIGDALGFGKEATKEAVKVVADNVTNAVPGGSLS